MDVQHEVPAALFVGYNAMMIILYNKLLMAKSRRDFLSHEPLRLLKQVANTAGENVASSLMLILKLLNTSVK